METTQVVASDALMRQVYKLCVVKLDITQLVLYNLIKNKHVK